MTLKRRRGRERRGPGARRGRAAGRGGDRRRRAHPGAAVSPALEATRRGEALQGALVAAGVRLEEVDDRDLADAGRYRAPPGRRRRHRAPRRGRSTTCAARRPVRWCWSSTLCRTPATSAPCCAPRWPWARPGSWPSRARRTSAIPRSARQHGRDLPASLRRDRSADDAQRLGRRATRPALWVTAADGEPVPRGAAHGRRSLLVLGNEGAGVGETHRPPARPARRHSARAWRRVAQRGGRGRHSSLRGHACRLMDWARPSSYVVAGIFGSALGSFLNVCILRWGAEPKESVHAPAVALPALRQPDRLVRQHPGGLVARPARQVPQLRAADLAAVSAGRTRDRHHLGVHGLALRSHARRAARRGLLHHPARHRWSPTRATTSSPTSSPSAASSSACVLTVAGATAMAGRCSRRRRHRRGGRIRPAVGVGVVGTWHVQAGGDGRRRHQDDGDGRRFVGWTGRAAHDLPRRAPRHGDLRAAHAHGTEEARALRHLPRHGRRRRVLFGPRLVQWYSVTYLAG